MSLRTALAWRTAIALAVWIATAPLTAGDLQAQEYQERLGLAAEIAKDASSNGAPGKPAAVAA